MPKSKGLSDKAVKSVQVPVVQPDYKNLQIRANAAGMSVREYAHHRLFGEDDGSDAPISPSIPTQNARLNYYSDKPVAIHVNNAVINVYGNARAGHVDENDDNND